MAQYGKNWGSVSTNFTRTTGFTSETKRLSQKAEDQYRKEKDQLSSMKETAAFDSKQMRSSAAMADKASAYELKALSKFSNKLNTFLQGTAAEWYKEEKQKDIDKKIIEYKTNRTKWNEDKVKLEELIAGTSDNDKKVAELQEQLKAHNLLNPDSDENIARLSGNEKIAYYSVTAAEQVEGAEGKYYNWVGEKGEETVIATWLPEEEYTDNLGNKSLRHPRIKINQITEPAGKQFLKDKFLKEQLEANPMGGLKDDYRVLLFAEPMSTALDKIQSTERTNFRQDQAKQKWDSTIQKVTNRLSGIPPFDNESNLGTEFNAALAEAGTIYVQTGKGTRQDGMNALFTAMMASVTNQTDKEKMQKAFNRLMKLGDEKITTGPNAGKTVKEAYGGPGGRWNETDITKEYQKALGGIKTAQETQITGQVEADVLNIKDTVTKGIAQEKEAWTPARAKAESETLWQGLFEKYRNNEYALTLLETMKGEATIGFTKQDWEAKWIDLGAQYRGVIPRKELAGIPKAYEEEFTKEHGWEVVTVIPGRKGTTNQSLHDSHIGPKGTLYSALREVEKINHQANPNGDTDIVYDLAGDKYQARVNQLVLVGDENGKKYSHREAMIKANNEIIAMIRNPNKVLEDGVTPNPFYASPNKSKAGAGNAWFNNEEVDKHEDRGLRLLSPGELVSKFAQEEVNRITDAGDKVQPSKDYLLTPISIDKETFQVKDSKQLEILGGVNNKPPGGALTMAYRKLGHNSGAKNFGDFVNKQRIAILRQTSPNGDPRNSTLWTDQPELMAAWFGDSKIETQRSRYMNTSSTNVDAAGLQSDYGGSALSPADAEAIVSGQGRETVIGGYN